MTGPEGAPRICTTPTIPTPTPSPTPAPHAAAAGRRQAPGTNNCY